MKLLICFKFLKFEVALKKAGGFKYQCTCYIFEIELIYSALAELALVPSSVFFGNKID
jgi:hypothetical protein